MSSAPQAQNENQQGTQTPATTYTFVAAQLRTRYLPGGNTQEVYQVTAQAVPSGVYFFHNFLTANYADPANVAHALTVIGQAVNNWSVVPGVVGMTAVQVIDAQDLFVNMFDVTVSSTSGNSTTVIRVTYPGLNHPGEDTQNFTAQVAQAVALLDAAESA